MAANVLIGGAIAAMLVSGVIGLQADSVQSTLSGKGVFSGAQKNVSQVEKVLKVVPKFSPFLLSTGDSSSNRNQPNQQKAPNGTPSVASNYYASPYQKIRNALASEWGPGYAGIFGYFNPYNTYASMASPWDGSGSSYYGGPSDSSYSMEPSSNGSRQITYGGSVYNTISSPNSSRSNGNTSASSGSGTSSVTAAPWQF